MAVKLCRGQLAYHLQDLHARYGAVVRTAPNELSFLDTAAWRDIYGRRTGQACGHLEIPKWQRFYRVHDTKGQTTIFNADIDLHARLRRQLAHGFSERSMRDQEGIIGSYVDLLIQRLHQNSNTVVDMTKWYVWTTFDIIGDLALGSSFDSLEKQHWHPWVWQLVKSPREFTFISSLRMLGLDWLVSAVLAFGMPARKRILALTADTLKKRIQSGGARPDLIEGMLQSDKTDVYLPFLWWARYQYSRVADI